MKKSRFTDEQIINFLKQAEGGVPVKDLCRKHGQRCDVLQVAPPTVCPSSVATRSRPRPANCSR